MSDSVYSYNLLPNPKPTDTSAWKFYSQKDLRVQMLSDNRLHITNNANIADSYIYTQLQLPAGTYRFGAEVSAPQGAYASNLLRVVIMPRTELTPATWDGTPGRIVTPANVVPEDSTVEFRVMVGPNANCAVWVRQLFVMSEEDYQQMISDGITWFDGDGIVAGGGFSLAACIHMWIAALCWWWLHEPAHHPTRRAAGHGVQKLRAHTETGVNHRHACGGHARIGHGRVAGGCATQSLSARRHREHIDTAACMGQRVDSAGGRGHANAIPNRDPVGFHQSEFGAWPIGAQRDRWIIHAPASRAHDEQRNGRIPCDRTVQSVLSVASGLEVAV